MSVSLVRLQAKSGDRGHCSLLLIRWHVSSSSYALSSEERRQGERTDVQALLSDMPRGDTVREMPGQDGGEGNAYTPLASQCDLHSCCKNPKSAAIHSCCENPKSAGKETNSSAKRHLLRTPLAIRPLQTRRLEFAS